MQPNYCDDKALWTANSKSEFVDVEYIDAEFEEENSEISAAFKIFEGNEIDESEVIKFEILSGPHTTLSS